MGRSTRELYDEARGWLLHWIGLATSQGQGEFDSPQYLSMYVTPMLLLYDFAAEPAMHQLAGMALDLLLADYLAESLEGAYCGGHSRAPGLTVEQSTSNRVSALHYLYAGGIPRPERLHGWMILAGLSDYRPPGVLAGIANQRERPYVHTEVKRVRNVMRFGSELNPPVYKVTYMTSRACLGSLQGGILQPIQQHTWDVTWPGSAPNATCFTVHPSVSARELAMFFPEELHGITATIAHQKGSYVSPDKLTSASPYEQIVQHEGELLALYQVPEGERFPHVTLYVPDCLTVTEGDDGWSRGQDGDCSFAWFACQEGAWADGGDGYRTRRYPAARAGFVVLLDPPGTLATPVLEGEGGELTLTWIDPRGRTLCKRWGDPRGTVDGIPAGAPERWLYRGPWLRSARGSRIITLTDGIVTRELDFNHLTITESR
jgi:hypothetical protein